MKTDFLSHCSFVEKYFHFDEIDSTNSYAKNLVDFPEKDLYIISADRQTAGRGQRGNSFFSELGGLYTSIVCRISDIGHHFTYNRTISLAIYDAVAALCPKAPLAIKWPNDIFWLNKKVCGILLETMPKSVQHILIGFGINVNIDCGRFPEELRNSATSLFIETGRAFDIAELLGDICNRFQTNRSIDPSMAHATYCKRLYKVGSAIRIQGREGIFKGVLEDGRLCIADDGKEEYLLSGSIEFIHNPA